MSKTWITFVSIMIFHIKYIYQRIDIFVDILINLRAQTFFFLSLRWDFPWNLPFKISHLHLNMNLTIFYEHWKFNFLVIIIITFRNWKKEKNHYYSSNTHTLTQLQSNWKLTNFKTHCHCIVVYVINVRFGIKCHRKQKCVFYFL